MHVGMAVDRSQSEWRKISSEVTPVVKELSVIQ
jgi:hypothetical protein